MLRTCAAPLTLLILLCALALLAGCRHNEPAPAPAHEIAQPLTDPRFTDILLQDAAAFSGWFTIDDARWSPVLCSPPSPLPRTYLSSSSDRETHGRKLYHLYVREPVPYGVAPPVATFPFSTVQPPHLHATQPVGQVLVKQTWVPREVPPDTLIGTRVRALDGKLYVPSERGPIFIMHKLDPSTPNTDQGWVYATLTPDGSQVTASGRIASCMKCHEVSAYDRMFGIQGR